MFTNPTLLTLFADARSIEARSPRRWTGVPLPRLTLRRWLTTRRTAPHATALTPSQSSV